MNVDNIEANRYTRTENNTNNEIEDVDAQLIDINPSHTNCIKETKKSSSHSITIMITSHIL